MSMIQLSLQHNTTKEDACQNLEAAVADVQGRFGSMVRQVDWADDRTKVTLNGPGVVVEMRVDATHVHASGNVPVLGKLLSSGVGKRIAEGIRGSLRKHFPKALPDSR